MMYAVVAELMRNAPDTQSFVLCILAICALVFTWRVMPRLADKGPEYMKEFGAYRLKMYELKHPKEVAFSAASEVRWQIPARPDARPPASSREVDEAA